MHISVIGCGYLGAVHAACLAKLGHQVVGLDVDQAKIDGLASGEPGFYEPGFTELLRTQLTNGRLTFTTDPKLISQAKLHFITVGTPQLPGHNAADLSYLRTAADTIFNQCASASEPVVIAGKSTVPVSTAARINELAQQVNPNLLVAWNPEFLREGFAVLDTLQPNRIVYGLPENSNQADICQRVLDECYAELLDDGTPRLITSYATAELVKVAANSFLATKISFINAMAELCDVAGADVTELATAIGYDDRIGAKFLRAGLGFGGGCLPKDIRAFMARAGELGVDEALTFLREVDAINLRQRSKVVRLAAELLANQLAGRKITVLGAAFKPDSDDLRDSPALDIAQQLAAKGAQVTITDPQAGAKLKKAVPNLIVAADIAQACQGAELVLLATEWQQYTELDPVWLGNLVRRRIIIDGRNVLDPNAWQQAGWVYRGIGRCGGRSQQTAW